MSAAALRMPLRTSQEAPSFSGAAHSLSRYLMTIEALCQDCRRTTAPELIKWAVYYANEMSEDTFAAARDALADPSSWDEFKATICGLYPQYEEAPMSVPLHASLLLPAVIPCAPLPPLLSAAAVLLAPDAIQALLLHPAPLMPSRLLPVPLEMVPTALPLPAPLVPSPPPVSAAPAPMPARAPLSPVPSVPVSPPVPPDPPLLPCAPLLPMPPVPPDPVPPSPAVEPLPLPMPDKPACLPSSAAASSAKASSITRGLCPAEVHC